MQEPLIITYIKGVPKEFFEEFEDLGIQVDFYERGPEALASYEKEIVEFLVVSTLMFPYDLAKTILIDSIKYSLIQKVLSLWDKLKGKNPAILKGGQVEYKKPSLYISVSIAENEHSVLELHNANDELLKSSVKGFFDLVELQIKHRTDENQLKQINPFIPKPKSKKK